MKIKFDFTNKPELYSSRFYRTWSNMKTRCYNKNVLEYPRYGGRGIVVCDRWQTFGGFFDDMYESYVNSRAEELNLTLDRINNNDDYFPDNCRWATKKEQALNTKNIDMAQRVIFDGKERTIREWSDILGIKRSTLSMRLNAYGWSPERAFSTKP